jgi:protein-disulfide isomerase
VVALAGVAILIAGQVLYRPASFKVSAVGEGRFEQTPTNRYFHIYQGRFTFDLNDVPLIGKPTAPHAMVSMFDYTCHFCRILHPTIKELHKTFPNELAIVSLPMPLDGQCNHLVRMTNPMHSNACEYARLGLAVWRANRQLHPQFDDWLFEPEHPPALATAREYAARLVGAQKLDAAYTNQWVNEQLQLAISVYTTNYLQTKLGLMPQVIIGTNLLAGTNTVEELCRRLENQLGLKAANPTSQAQ